MSRSNSEEFAGGYSVRIVLLSIILLAGGFSMAESPLKVAGIFTDHAVLQRDMPLPVWGHAAPGSPVSAELAGVSAATVASPDGSFLLRLPALEAGGPYVLQVSAGGETAVFQDVYVGEVWLCAGQSNMEFPLAGEIPAVPPEALDRPLIRHYRMPPAAWFAGKCEADGEWQAASPETAGGFSAVGFHFAEKLNAELGVAVGIVNVSYGGTNIAAWLSPEALYELDFMRDRLMRYQREADPVGHLNDKGEPDRGLGFNAFLATLPDAPHPERAEDGWQLPEFDDSGWQRQRLPDEWLVAGFVEPGIYRYRLAVELPGDWAGKELELGLGAVDQQDTAYFNGVRVGATGSGKSVDSWAVQRRYRIPGELVKAGVNTIAVRVTSIVQLVLSGGFCGPAEAMYLARADRPDERIPLATEWGIALEQHFEPTATPMAMQLSGAGEAHSLGIMYANMVRPLIPYALKGVVWYQGEADANHPEMAGHYLAMLQALRRDWRQRWMQDELEFLIVQLPGFMGEAEFNPGGLWPLIRQAQLQAALDDASYPAVLTDSGEAYDLHPPDKRNAGERLARLTLGLRRNDPSLAHGPRVLSAGLEPGGAVTLVFDAVGDGLQWRDGEEPWGWYVSDAEGGHHRARAAISGKDRIILEAPGVTPAFVHYGVSYNPKRANLVNSHGNPASPFTLPVTE